MIYFLVFKVNKDNPFLEGEWAFAVHDAVAVPGPVDPEQTAFSACRQADTGQVSRG